MASKKKTLGIEIVEVELEKVEAAASLTANYLLDMAKLGASIAFDGPQLVSDRHLKRLSQTVLDQVQPQTTMTPKRQAKPKQSRPHLWSAPSQVVS